MRIPSVQARGTAVGASPLRRISALALTLAALPAGAAAQPGRPIAAPVAIPAPANVLARQTGATELTVSWGAVPLADRYLVSRRVGSFGWQRVGAGVLTDTLLVDHDVPVGAPLVYQVVAVATSHGASPGALSPSVGIAPPPVVGGGGPAPSLTSAGAIWTGPAEALVRWSALPGDAYYAVRRLVNGAPDRLASWTVPPGSAPEARDVRVPAGVTVRYDVTAYTLDFAGVRRPRGTAVTDALPARGSAAAGAADVADLGGVGGDGGAMVTVAPAVLFGAGAPGRRLAQPAGGAVRWLSLDETIAAVDGQGLVQPRRPGDTRVLATSLGVDHVVRITVTRVLVAR